MTYMKLSEMYFGCVHRITANYGDHKNKRRQWRFASASSIREETKYNVCAVSKALRK